ncbi:hypothetical protein F3K37_42910 [Streptomyces sp. LBUM 1477]|nr:hypothetical protein [Streptomyces sp. LBUM 1485]MBP5880827.1 hypothetical protein [Streptomyces sp. LBUM 1477]
MRGSVTGDGPRVQCGTVEQGRARELGQGLDDGFRGDDRGGPQIRHQFLHLAREPGGTAEPYRYRDRRRYGAEQLGAEEGGEELHARGQAEQHPVAMSDSPLGEGGRTPGGVADQGVVAQGVLGAGLRDQRERRSVGAAFRLCQQGVPHARKRVCHGHPMFSSITLLS